MQVVIAWLKLQALVYDILPSTTAVFSYAIGSRKLSANEQFFVGAQTVVSLLQTTQIISDVNFITDHVAYASSNPPPNHLNRDGTPLFTRGGCVSCLRACLGARSLPNSKHWFTTSARHSSPTRKENHGKPTRRAGCLPLTQENCISTILLLCFPWKEGPPSTVRFKLDALLRVFKDCNATR